MLIQKAIVTAFPASTALPTNNKQSPTDTSPFLCYYIPHSTHFPFALSSRDVGMKYHIFPAFSLKWPWQMFTQHAFLLSYIPPTPPFLINKFAPLPLPLMYLPYYLLSLERVNGLVGILWIPSQPLQMCKKSTRGPQ